MAEVNFEETLKSAKSRIDWVADGFEWKMFHTYSERVWFIRGIVEGFWCFALKAPQFDEFHELEEYAELAIEWMERRERKSA